MLQSGGDLFLNAGRDVQILSREERVGQAFGAGYRDESITQAVDGLKVDLKHIDQQSVSQTIDAMVQADPSLAWIKELEQRGDVDWQRVREVHDSFKYSHSGLGAGAQLAIAILVAYFTAGAASGLAASGASAAGASTAASSAWAAGAGASLQGIGWANAAATAAVTGAASNTAISTINNRGNLGAVVDDVTSSDALRGYVVAGATAGLTAGYFNDWTSTQTSTGNAVQDSVKVLSEGGLSSWNGIGSFAGNQLLQNGTSTLLDRALGGDSKLGDALRSSLANTFAAAGFNFVGDLGDKFDLSEGGLAKIGLHAVMGGLAAEAAGGDFRTGALAAGVNEALVDSLAQQYAGMDPDQKKGLLVMNSQLIGLLAAATQSNADAESVQTGAWVAQNATQYNRQLHLEEKDLAKDLADKSNGRFTADEIEEQLRLSFVKGTEVTPSTDMVVENSLGIYDPDGNWVDLGGGYQLQKISKGDMDVVAYIKQSTDEYTWLSEVEYGYSRLIKSEWPASAGGDSRDRLTGYVLDDRNGYRIPVVVDGSTYAPRFHSCGTVECLASGVNIDFSDVNTLRWVRATDAKAVSDLSRVMAAGAVVSSGGAASFMAGASTTVGLMAGYLKGDFVGAATSVGLSTGFESYAASKGVPIEVAGKIANSLTSMGVWDAIVENAREVFSSDE
ncbi:DUF637 domain-containing protein [Pseudomonas sp. TCU-HL1]|uniref:DUF637 domain-containing protein n=1 Tax=Pseudomonas sp. TCU-HL1 TaxID=1856685 RepID=UPI00083DE191|nr:hypothetical protein THL1_5367 [Pseudomonas sp. TCU-HL1]